MYHIFSYLGNVQGSEAMLVVVDLQGTIQDIWRTLAEAYLDPVYSYLQAEKKSYLVLVKT